MPLIKESTYRAPFWLYSNHMETIIPGILRRPKPLAYQRHRITTRDSDFLDLDYLQNSNNRIAVLSHGLEGHSDKYYMRGMAHALHNTNWDVCSWNCRSCSKEINLTPRLYHHGATEDLEEVIMHVKSMGYGQILLVGFSMGGSLTIKYLGENGSNLPDGIIGGIAFSTPCQLGSCARQLSAAGNRLYLDRFLTKLKNKIRVKAAQFPNIIDASGIDAISSFYEFDSRYSAPLSGFTTAEEFYSYASAGNYIEGIERPTLLVNSINDPMFPGDCYPYKQAKDHPYFYLETPGKGGHMGYWRPGQKQSWAEKRALEFIEEHLGTDY